MDKHVIDSHVWGLRRLGFHSHDEAAVHDWTLGVVLKEAEKDSAAAVGLPEALGQQERGVRRLGVGPGDRLGEVRRVVVESQRVGGES